MQADATALNVTALCYDPVAACLLGPSACLVVLVVCSSLLRMCLLSLSGYLVCLLGLVDPKGHVAVGCHLRVKSRNGLHGIWLYVAFGELELMCRPWDVTDSESLPTN